MRKILNLGAYVFIFLFCLNFPGLNADSQFPDQEGAKPPTISLDFQDVRLKDILKIFSMQSGLNFIASEAVQDREITLYLDKVPLDKAMDKLFKANNLSYDLDKSSKIFTVTDWGKPEAETVTRVFYLKYATVSSSALNSEIGQGGSSTTSGGTSGGTSGAASFGAGLGGSSGSSRAGSSGGGGRQCGITQAVTGLLSDKGSVIEDFRTNSIIVTDTPNRMPVIAQVIASLDVPVPQVLIEVEMLDVSKATVDKMGVKFGQTPLTLNLIGATRFTQFPFSSWLSDGSATSKAGSSIPGHFTAGSVAVNSAGYSIILDFLKTQTDTKYLARPRILTLNNETAEIKITTQETVGVTTSTTTTEGTAQTAQGTPERVETGVSLRVTPQVNPETGEITMFIIPSVKDTSTSTFLTQGSSSQYFKDPEERSTRSVVRIKDGETVIIGGLIRNDMAQTVTKLPVLGDLPIVGALFRHKDKTRDRERELLVFITPHIVKDTDVKLARKKIVELPEREQNTVSGFNRESSINESLDTYERRKK